MRWYITFQICLCHAYNCSKYKSHFTLLKDKRKEIKICLFAFQLHTLLNIFHSLACKCITLSKHYNVSSVKVIHIIFVPLFQPHTLASKHFRILLNMNFTKQTKVAVESMTYSKLLSKCWVIRFQFSADFDQTIKLWTW